MISNKGLNKSEQLMSHTIEDVRQWEPSQPETNPYDVTELEQAYGQSFNSMQLGQAMYATAMDMMQETVSDFKGRLGILEADAAEAQQMINSQDSVTRAEGQRALEQNLMYQSRQGNEFSQGSKAAQQMEMLSNMGANVTQISTAAGVAGSNEEMNRRATSYTAMQNSNDAIMGALGGAAQGALGMQRLGGVMQTMGLGGMTQAASNMSGDRLKLAQSALTHSGMQADALKARLGAAGKRSAGEQAAYEARVKGRLEADQIRRGNRRKMVGGIASGIGGIGSGITTIMKPKKEKGKK